MGLAVLPARLKEEMGLLADEIITGKDISADEKTAKHLNWYNSFKDNYKITDENVHDVLKTEIGKTFVKVLEDAGVYKRTEEGKEAFMRFVRSI